MWRLYFTANSIWELTAKHRPMLYPVLLCLDGGWIHSGIVESAWRHEKNLYSVFPDQVRHNSGFKKPSRLEISDLGSRGIVLSVYRKQRRAN